MLLNSSKLGTKVKKEDKPIAEQFCEDEHSVNFLSYLYIFGQAVTEKKNFFNQPIRNKSRLWRPCLLTDRDEMSNLYRGPSIDISYQVSVHLAEGFYRHIYL